MSVILAIDPGVKQSAAALSIDGALYQVWFIDMGLLADGAPFASGASGARIEPTRVVVEKPQHDGRSSRVPPGVLIDLAYAAGLVAGACAAGWPIVAYTPREWKGSIAKPIHHMRLWSVLSEHERALFPEGTFERIQKGVKAQALRGTGKGYASAVHNLLDAAALNLFHLKRLGVGGQRPRR